MNEREIFAGALEISDPARRDAYLDQACGQNAPLRARIVALLASHENASQFLNVPLVEQLKPPTAEITHPTIDLSSARKDNSDDESAAAIDLSFLEPSSRHDSIGRLGHYEVRRVLGQGAFGIVFKAFDEKLHRLVAIKVMSPQLAATSPPRKRFLREARSAAAIKHENIVQVYSVDEQPLPYLVMEYIDGPTLQQKLDGNGPLETGEVLHIGRQIAAGLAAAHSQGLIHRDIKPGNILIEQGTDQRVKITDFGLARATDDASMTQSGMIAGTPMYMAPEQALGQTLDHRADLFSLGSVLYQMACGHPPFRGSSTVVVLRRVVEDTPRPLQEVWAGIPDWLCAVINKLHAKRVEDRFQTAQEVADVLVSCLADLRDDRPVTLPADIALPATTSNPPEPATKPAKSLDPKPRFAVGRRSLSTAAALLLVLIGSLGLTEATGVTNVRGTVIRLFSPEGTLVVEVDDPGVSVTIDGEELVITGTGAKEIRLKPGEYKVLASKDGRLVSQELVTVTRNGRQVVRVSREADRDRVPASPDAEARVEEMATLSAGKKADAVRQEFRGRNPDFQGVIAFDIQEGQIVGCKIAGGSLPDLAPLLVLKDLRQLDYEALGPKRDAPVLREMTSLQTINGYSAETFRLAYPANKSPSVDAEWLDAVATLPVETRADVVVKKLKELNPGYDGRIRTRIEDGRVTTLSFDSAEVVTNLSPLQALPYLQSLTATAGFARSWLSDLSPLSGLPLTDLNLTGAQVSDLTPLKGMPLEQLNLRATPVTNLAPLKDSPLKTLNCQLTPLSDLSPLEGMPLTIFQCGGTRVSDLTPLKGMQLTTLWCALTPITDLSPLEGMPLTVLNCGDTRVSDLSPLKGMPLEALWIPNVSAENLDIVRGIKSLKTINGKPAAEFWKQLDGSASELRRN